MKLAALAFLVITLYLLRHYLPIGDKPPLSNVERRVRGLQR